MVWGDGDAETVGSGRTVTTAVIGVPAQVPKFGVMV
jgi:hypothetical protein